MSANPFAALNKAVAAVDEDARNASGKCARCGLDRGGIIPRGQTRREAGICNCAPRRIGDGDDAE